MDRFFCPALAAEPIVTLEGDEFHHLAHVLRVKPGQTVELFDGQGNAQRAVVEQVSKRAARLTRIDVLRSDPVPLMALTLAVACPKGDRLKWLVEKATELGVAEFIPLHCERSVVEPRESKLARLEQTVLAACKQSRRNRLMTITEPCSLEDLLAASAGHTWLAHPGGRPVLELLANQRQSAHQQPLSIRAAIGPEGGFSPAEVDRAEHSGAQLVSIGRSILRVETAALSLAALVHASEFTSPS